MRYMIPSYHRCGGCTTARYLHECGVTKESIVIGTQTADDYESYTRAYGKIAEVMYKDASNCAGNRNNLLEYADIGETVVLMDDDIRKLQRFDVPKTGHGIATDIHGKAIEETFGTLARIRKKSGASVAGIANHSNVVNLERLHRTGKKWETSRLLSGMVMLIDGGKRQFDESYDCLDDFELCLRVIESGGTTLRANWIIASKPQDTTNVGGCKKVYESGGKRLVLERLEKRYGGIAKIKKNWSGMQLRSGLR